MEKAKEWLELNGEETETVSRLTIHPHRVGLESSFYEDFALRGIRVDRVDPGLVTCTFKVPPRLTDKKGNLANGAIVNLIDVVGGAVVHIEGLPFSVSVDMSISFVSTAKLNRESENQKMEKAKDCLELNEEESETVSRLTIHPHRVVGVDSSFYEDFALRGIRVDRVEPGLVSCTFKVPPRLTDNNGNLANGAIANLIDEVGGAVVYVEGLPMKVSVDMSISFISPAKLDVREPKTILIVYEMIYGICFWWIFYFDCS